MHYVLASLIFKYYEIGGIIMNNPVISKHLIETGAYSDLKTPVIVTSGKFLTPFFVNTEKLCRGDDISGFLKKHGNDPEKIIDYAWESANKNPEFMEDIEIIAAIVEENFKKVDIPRKYIAGGMRRDLFFSGLVAKILNLPHIAAYKTDDGGNITQQPMHIMDPKNIPQWTSDPSEFVPNYNFEFNNKRYDGAHAIIISDLLTAGSSQYRIDSKSGLAVGWVPNLRLWGFNVTQTYGIVTRLQGGEENLANIGVDSHSFVAIDEEFLNGHAKDPKSAIEYIKNPEIWTKMYIAQNGVSVLVPFFNPEGSKLDRAKKFLDNYDDFLEASGFKGDLVRQVEKTYNTKFDVIMGDK